MVKKMAQEKDVRVTGFVDENDIPNYFQAADLVVLPYRTLMSSSGPLSLALSFKKPFLISEAMAPITKTADFPKADVVYNGTIEKNPDTLKELEKVSIELSKKRSWSTIGKKYYEEIFN